MRSSSPIANQALCQGTAFSRAVKSWRAAPSLLPQAEAGARRAQPEKTSWAFACERHQYSPRRDFSNDSSKRRPVQLPRRQVRRWPESQTKAANLILRRAETFKTNETHRPHPRSATRVGVPAPPIREASPIPHARSPPLRPAPRPLRLRPSPLGRRTRRRIHQPPPRRLGITKPQKQRNVSGHGFTACGKTRLCIRARPWSCRNRRKKDLGSSCEVAIGCCPFGRELGS